MPATFGRTETLAVVFTDDGHTCRRADEHEAPHAELLTGPSAEGGFIRVILDPTRTPVGPSVAPRIVAALAFADANLGTTIGPLTAPIPVR